LSRLADACWYRVVGGPGWRADHGRQLFLITLIHIKAA